MAELEQAADDLRGRIETAERAGREADARLATLEGELRDARTDLDAARSRNEELAAVAETVETQATRITALQSDLAAAAESREAARSDATRRAAQLAQVEAELATARTDARERAVSLEERARRAEEKIIELEREVTDARATASVAGESDESRQRTAELEARVTLAVEREAAAQTQIVALRAELESLRGDDALRLGASSDLARREHEMEERTAQVQAELTRIDARDQELRSQLAEQRALVEGLEAERARIDRS